MQYRMNTIILKGIFNFICFYPLTLNSDWINAVILYKNAVCQPLLAVITSDYGYILQVTMNR